MQTFASGTSWLPASSPHGGILFKRWPWSLTIHGFANLVFADDTGPRGDAGFSARLGPGRVEARVMLSAEPTMGRDGYPLLLQTGETADGVNPLVDRQHPYDLFMDGYVYELPFGGAVGVGLGVSGRVHLVPRDLEPIYGAIPSSYLLFTHFRLR